MKIGRCKVNRIACQHMMDPEGEKRNHLNMQGTGDDMAYEKVSESHLPRPAAVQECAIPSPKEKEAGYFQPPSPISSLGAFLFESLLVKKAIRVGVEIESGKRHHEIENLVLNREDYLGKLIKF